MLLGTACGDDEADSGDEPLREPPCSTRFEQCDCDYGTSDRQVDCNGDVIVDCMCPQMEECVGDAGCSGSRICRASGTCDDCICDATLVASGDGAPLDMAWSLDGTAYVLLSDAPWLQHVESGTASPVAVRSDTSWAAKLVVDVDGSLLLFGTVCPDTECFVQVQRLSASGELIGATQWALDDLSTALRRGFAGAARRSDGSIAVSAISGSVVAHATLSADTQITEVTTVDLYTASADAEVGNRVANRLMLGPADEVVLGGYLESALRIDGTWYASFTRDGSLISELVETDYDLFNPQTLLAVSSSGDVYQAWTWRFTEREPLDGYLRRSSVELAPIWDFQMESDTADEIIDEVVALHDSGVFFRPGAVTRIPKSGPSTVYTSLVRMPGSDTALIEAELVSDREVALLTLTATDGFRVSALTFEPLGSLTEPGGTCAEDAECQSGQCCSRGSTPSGVCSEGATCPSDSACSGDAECAGGLCLVPASTGEGQCTGACSGSSECPAGAYCGQIVCATAACPLACLSDCLVGGTNLCTSVHPSLVCGELVNTEGVMVSVCQ